MKDEPIFVLDSFALLAFFQGEPRGVKVKEIIERSLREECRLALATVNLGEVVYRTIRQHGPERTRNVLAKIEEFGIAIVDVDRDLALEAANLKVRYRLGYADCFVAALARRLDAAVVTGDPDFRQVEQLIAVEWLPTQ